MVWALGTNGNEQLQGALTNANALLASTDTNLTAILLQLADITSNLNAQVQANTNMLGSISKTVMDADDFVQGLKHHWLLRSAFKKENKTNAPAARMKRVIGNFVATARVHGFYTCTKNRGASAHGSDGRITASAGGPAPWRTGAQKKR